MPDNISLNIPVDIRTPGQYIEIDPSMAVAGLPQQQRRLLVLGHARATSPTPVLTPKRVTSAAHAESLWKPGCMISAMLKALFDARIGGMEVWGMSVQIGAGVEATYTVTITGPATAGGTLALYVMGYRYAIAVTSGDTATTIGDAIAAAITANPRSIVTAANVAGVVTLTVRNAGTYGNSVDVRVNYYQGEVLPAGVGVAIAAGVTGTGTPDMAAALAAIADDTYQTIICPWSDDAVLTDLETELDTRWGPLEQRAAHAYTAVTDTYADTASWGAARNNVHVSALGIGASPTFAPVQAAIFGAVCHYYGGIDPARPFQTLSLPGVLPPAEADLFTRDERNLLLWDGISTAKPDDGGVMRIERVITNNQTTSGVEDTAFLDLNTVLTVDYIRYAVRARIALRYPRHKLADDGTRFAPGQAVATPRLIRGELIALFKDLEEAGLVENLEQYKTDLVVVRSDADPNRVNAIIPPDIVNQFRVFAAAIQFRL